MFYLFEIDKRANIINLEKKTSRGNLKIGFCLVKRHVIKQEMVLNTTIVFVVCSTKNQDLLKGSPNYFDAQKVQSCNRFLHFYENKVMFRNNPIGCLRKLNMLKHNDILKQVIIKNSNI